MDKIGPLIGSAPHTAVPLELCSSGHFFGFSYVYVQVGIYIEAILFNMNPWNLEKKDFYPGVKDDWVDIIGLFICKAPHTAVPSEWVAF